MKPLTIGGLVAPLPIIQGGMGIGVSLSRLASAVSNQGGIGVISAACIGNVPSPDGKKRSNVEALTDQIRGARSLTKGILGVNIMVALTDYADMVKTAIAEGVDIIFAGAGLPLTLPSFLKSGSKTRLVPIVSSGKAARLITKRWKDKYNYTPDAFVVEGPLAGGHLGFSKEQIDNPAYRLENLVKDVLVVAQNSGEKSEKAIPVIAAGGIYSGQDIFRFLQLGASGVQMATRFVATEECDATMGFKNAYIACKKEEIGIVQSPVGMPGRAVINSFMDRVAAGLTRPKHCPFGCIISCEREESPYCITSALVTAHQGKTDSGLVFIGANGYKVNEIVSVKQLIDSLIKEFISAAGEADGFERMTTI